MDHVIPARHGGCISEQSRQKPPACGLSSSEGDTQHRKLGSRVRSLLEDGGNSTREESIGAGMGQKRSWPSW